MLIYAVVSLASMIMSLCFARVRIVLTTYVYGTLCGYSWKTLNCVMAQFRHETANFTSSVYLRANNVSGMKVPKIRASFGIVGESNGYAVYRGVVSSVIDYFYRQKEFGMPKAFDDPVISPGAGGGPYLQMFCSWNKESGYYEDTLTNYLNGCARWMSTNTAKFFGLSSGGNYTLQDKLIFWSVLGSIISNLYLLYVLVKWCCRKWMRKGRY